MKKIGGCMNDVCMVGGHLFDFNKQMWNSSSPLLCHDYDCVMNVFTLLGLVSRTEAINIATKSSSIRNRTIITFLDNTFHVNHEIKRVFYLPEDVVDTEDIIGKLMKMENYLLSIMEVNTAFIGGVPNHLVVIAKERGKDNVDHIYIYDPQTHTYLPIISSEMLSYVKINYYIDIYISYEESVRKIKQIQQLKRSAMMNKHLIKHISLRQRSAPLKTKSKTKSNYRRSF